MPLTKEFLPEVILLTGDTTNEILHLFASLFSGPGDGFFSSAFQSTLKGNVLYKNAVPAGWYCLFKKDLALNTFQGSMLILI